ncbi:hypothetical protein JCM14036_31280 [Desulfotomaculum defluvii]
MAAASEPGESYTASQLSQKAIEFIHKQYKAGVKIDGYTAYVLTLSGEDLGSEKWTNNGKTLKKEIVELSDLLGDNLTLVSYICATQNGDGSFGPLGNEYGTKVPLLALASIKDDLESGADKQQVEDTISKAITYFKQKYQNGTIAYDAQGFDFDYRCIEALVKAGEDLSVGGWVQQEKSLEEIVIASAVATASDQSATAVELAKELTALNAVQSYSANAVEPRLATAVSLEAAPNEAESAPATEATAEEVNNETEIDQDEATEVEIEATFETESVPATEATAEEVSNETEIDKNEATEIEIETTFETESAPATEATAEEVNNETEIDQDEATEIEIETKVEVESAPTTEAPTEEEINEVEFGETTETKSSLTDEVYSDIVTEINLDETNLADSTVDPTVRFALVNKESLGAPDIATLASAIAERQAADGSFGNNIYDHVTVLIALGKAGILGSIDQGKAFTYIDGLKKSHKDIFGYDAGVAWGSEWTPEEADTTAQVITALSYFDKTTDVNKTIQDGLTYLMDVQDPDRAAIAINSWDSTYNTAETLIALKALGRSYDEYAGSNSTWKKKSRTNTMAKCLLALSQWNDTTLRGKLADQLVQRHVGKESFENSVYSDMWAYIALGEVGMIGSLNINDVKEYILAKQNKVDGSWGETFGSYYPDFLSTTQAIRSLAYLPDASTDQEIQSAINNGLKYLKGLQQTDGGVYSTWDDPAMDNSGVIITLKKLGIDPSSTEWKNANGLTPVDYLLNNTMNGDGTFGTLKNITGATEALAAYRLVSGQGNPGGGNTPPTDPAQDQCSVEIAIVGKGGDLLFGPSSVMVGKDSQGKLTVLGALEATGLGYTESGGLVTSIDGQRNEGLKGWMYKVNGSSPAVAASDKTVKEGDEILWWYSTSASNSGPTWDSVSEGEVVTPELGLLTNLQEQNKNLPAALQASEDTLAALENINQTLGLQENTFELGNLGQGGQAVVVVGDRKPVNMVALASEKDILQKPLQIQQRVAADQGAALAEEGGQLGLIVPAQSLAKDTEITISKLAKDNTQLPTGLQRLSATYEFGPDGTEFSIPATLALQVVIPPLVKPESIYLAWFNQKSGNWVAVPAVVDLNKGLVWGRIQHFSKYAIFAQEAVKSFTDVNSGSCGWAQNSIEVLAGADIVGGVDGNIFEPLRPVTRAEFTVMLVKALALPTQNDVAETFTDVKADDWYAGALATAYESGLVKGYKDGFFCPNNTITREEVAAILARALDLQPSEQILPFADSDNVKPWAKASVLAVSEKGLVKGFPDETFRPDRTTSRAECAVMIYRMLANL